MAVMTVRNSITLVVVIAFVCGISLNYFQVWADNAISQLRQNLGTDRRQKVLIIMTQTRCGSSFAGELFAATKNTLYLYEPLYPFGTKCQHFQAGKRALLNEMLGCDFSSLKNLYSYGFNKSEVNDTVAGCIKNGICFAGPSTGLLDSYQKLCSSRSGALESESCGYPLRAELLTALCTSSDMLVTKLTRVCKLEDIEDVYRHLKSINKDVFILHLVRDPRTMVLSYLNLPAAAKLAKKPDANNNSYVKERCLRQRLTLKYAARAHGGSSILGDGRYIRIRYEDLTANAKREAEKVFKIMGSSLPPEVVSNIRNFLHPNETVIQQMKKHRLPTGQNKKLHRQYMNPFGVVRDQMTILDKWRNSVSLHVIEAIQNECEDVMKMLGYIPFKSEKQLKDLSNPYFVNADPQMYPYTDIE